jgi:hypothetical protein
MLAFILTAASYLVAWRLAARCESDMCLAWLQLAAVAVPVTGIVLLGLAG